MYRCENWTIKKVGHQRIDAFGLWFGEDSWESLGLQGDPTSPSWRRSVLLNIHWKDRCWSWSSNTSATWCEELTHWKRPWCWRRLKVGGEGDDRGWDGWMASPTRWTWVWANSRRWWRTGKPGLLQSMRSQIDMTEQLMLMLPEPQSPHLCPVSPAVWPLVRVGAGLAESPP